MAKAGELKTVLITGGTYGFGKATAVLLAGQGYRVIATGRNAERRAQLEALARERKLPLTTVEMDVREDASVERGLAGVRAELGPIDVLINNAGVGYYAVMEEIRMEDLRQQFETNFFGAVRLIQRVLPEMRARRGGRIINMSSIAGKYAFPLFGPYSASKFALEAMSDALRMEVRPFGIHVVLIEPGFIPTGFQTTAREMSSEYVKNVERSAYAQLYKNYGRNYRESTATVQDKPEDCARVILRAVRAERPRARYTVTRRAQVLSFAKRFVTDRFLDWRFGKSLGWQKES
jgi:NAD(P)-dependent dehydrogenase (short-subunit alcohol dehydrogenase family)